MGSGQGEEKAAVVRWYWEIAAEQSQQFGRKFINAIAPGGVNTSIGATSQDGGLKDTNAAVPMQKAKDNPGSSDSSFSSQPRHYCDRFMELAEIAHIGVFLASGWGSAISGQVIIADCSKTSAPLGETILGHLEALRPFV
ncbi:hypothetical protein BDZ85DRAFT_283633 [Elsinoe ampelina]|uniref:Uncharacterized protein n=1 Tax=Elsinoe ampelina TaxID=302913 RepID=A0A6A6G7A8_9PEZI|nr:hypothetical protein BDZ85DRAFT_283633 [Elsinoe ampelina]